MDGTSLARQKPHWKSAEKAQELHRAISFVCLFSKTLQVNNHRIQVYRINWEVSFQFQQTLRQNKSVIADVDRE